MHKLNPRTGKKARSFVTLLIAVAGCAVVCSRILPAAAQPLDTGQAATVWETINESNSRIRSCRVTWKRVTKVKQTYNKGVVDTQNTSGYTSTLEFVRIGQTVHCDITSHHTSGPDQQPKTSRFIDYYDGTNSVFMELEVMGTKVGNDAMLTREPGEALSHSAGTWQTPRFLLGFPLGETVSDYNPPFTPVNATVSKDAQSNFSLQRTINPSAGETGVEFPAILTLTLDTNYRPVRYEVLNTAGPGAGGRKMGQVDLSGYRQYQDGIWFPSKVVISTPAFTAEYTLMDAAFNDEVHPWEVLLPPDTRIMDFRFGSDQNESIAYKLRDGRIPTDEEVRKLLKR